MFQAMVRIHRLVFLASVSRFYYHVLQVRAGRMATLLRCRYQRCCGDSRFMPGFQGQGCETVSSAFGDAKLVRTREFTVSSRVM